MLRDLMGLCHCMRKTFGRRFEAGLQELLRQFSTASEAKEGPNGAHARILEDKFDHGVPDV
ncbi:hypothetical protein HPP92_005330 [Vanilla planifolia]|uniref:Uncharacterized protein n=1 Tax=Vanilla planifolia TaxID=51239 RepID=A0A835VCT4_VANPL|nr:hypothetical protein HPP92_005648 [Vanilla planifolia]KAG0494336.1 hypothetical protein HPP92_005330 [Vanilla planifolia]